MILLILLKNFSKYETTDNAYIRGSITAISSRVEGYVTEVPGVLNTKVNKGDLLVKFDENTFKSKVSAARAEFEASKALILETESLKKSENLKIDEKKLNRDLAKNNIDSAKSRMASENSNLVMLEKEKNRIAKLLKSNNATKSEYERALSKFEVSLYKVKQYEIDIKAAKIAFQVIEKEISKLQINLEKLNAEEQKFISKRNSLEANLESKILDLESTNIYSPIDGIIANRIVEPGVYMKNGWPLMSIVPVNDVWVIANFKETQIKNLEAGQKANIKVDAFPKIKLNGKVLSFSPASASSFSLIPPQNASGNFVKVVQRIPVKILIDLPDNLVGKIVPGLSVYVKVFTGKK